MTLTGAPPPEAASDAGGLRRITGR